MLRISKVLVIIMLTMFAVGLYYEGHQYLTVGIGFTPYIGWPLSVVCLLCCFWVDSLLTEQPAKWFEHQDRRAP